jgi:dienelactone hydrolase
VVGEKDGLKATNERYHELLQRLGLKHEFHVIPEAIHSPNPLYDGLGDKNWEFLKAALAGQMVSSAAAPQPASPPVRKPEPPTTAPATQAKAGTAPANLQLSGERWICEAGGQPFSGILLKPDGNGPFPAALISHGLGGSAESFGLSKAREFVKWGLVCIAPNYTHNVRAAGKGVAPGGKAARGAHPPDYGASEENLRRARTCVEILRGLPYVDGKRIAAYGHSMGGFVTIGLAATAPDLLKAAAITGSGVAPRAGYPAPSAELAAKIRSPFFILHGGNDPVVRPEQSASLKEVLDRNRVPNERRVFDGEGHAIDQSKREEVFNAIRDWFRRHGMLQP